MLIYTEKGSKILGEHWHKMPMILSGDFNINFAEESSKPLIGFLKDKLNLTMSNDKTISTTRFGYVDRFYSRVLYFSYHKPKVSF